MGFFKYRRIFIFMFCAILSFVWAGCATKPVVIDTSDIEQLRNNYNQLRNEYDKLQQDYKGIVESGRFYADYYQQATEGIANGLAELERYGSGNLDEIAKLRYLVIQLRGIVQGIVDLDAGSGQ